MKGERGCLGEGGGGVRPILTNPLAKTNTGQAIFGPIHFCPVHLDLCVFVRVVPKGWAPNPEKWGPKGGAPKGGAPKGGGPKISRFFFPSPAPIFVLLSLSGCHFVEFWWCAETLKCARSCEAPDKPLILAKKWIGQNWIG